MSFLDEDVIPQVPIGDWFSDLVDWVQNNLQGLLDIINTVLQSLDDWLSAGLNAVPALVMVGILGGYLQHRWQLRCVAIPIALLLVVAATELRFPIDRRLRSGERATDFDDWTAG